MGAPKQQLSHKQYIFYIYKTQIGIGVLVLPNTLSKMAGNSGWISLLLGWMIATAAGYFIIQVMKRHPGRTFAEVLQDVLGKWIGRAVMTAWIAYAAIAVGVVLFMEVIIIQVWILRNMEQLLLIAAIMIPVFMITRNRLQVQGRYVEFVYLYTLWMPPLLFFSLKDSHVLNLLPIAGDGLLPILYGIKPTLIPFLGFETAYMLYPHLQDKTKAFRGLLIANSLALIIFMTVVVTSTMYFSSEELRTFIWPTMQLLKTITLPFIERFEIVFLSYYIILVTQTLCAYLFFTANGIKDLFGLQDHAKLILPLLVLLLAAAAILKPTLEGMEATNAWYDIVSIGMGYAFPLLFWGLWQARKLGERVLR
ncbi:GerAB/ArcD/ProY family transporter [Paenibacillus soyae]|uniref:Spore germination protein n=1 Tax=Paenibacillus soyae TaxID=2969249 RepID=A0A9X2MNJ5_9BACL|nr:spore germination protein [Paenibacillus soyae]MCR2805228.1 spore germination protein [Paenibacillus soyae]